jgi:hypothetical protein
MKTIMKQDASHAGCKRTAFIISMMAAAIILTDLISPAEAIVGRPLTPMSYAGVARRTVRRSYVYGMAPSQSDTKLAEKSAPAQPASTESPHAADAKKTGDNH